MCAIIKHQTVKNLYYIHNSLQNSQKRPNLPSLILTQFRIFQDKLCHIRAKKRRRSQTTMSFHFSIFSAMQSSDLKISSLEKKESSENGWFMKKVKELNKTQQLASHKSWNEILEAAAAQREPNIENSAVTELLVIEKKGFGRLSSGLRLITKMPFQIMSSESS